MGELIQGFDQSVNDEYARLRGEIAVAIGESGYTMEQVAALAGISRRTLHNLLTGAASVGTDTLIRVAFIVGGRLEVARPAEGEGARPFQVVTSESQTASRSTSSRRSSSRSAGADLTQGSGSSSRRSSAKQGKKKTRRVNRTSWFDRCSVRPATTHQQIAKVVPLRASADTDAFGSRPAPIPQKWGESGDEFESVSPAA